MLWCATTSRTCRTCRSSIRTSFSTISHRIWAKGFANKLQQILFKFFQVTSILKYLFPVPKKDSQRVITFANEEDFISFRQHTWKKGDGGEIELTELGPRFELRRLLRFSIPSTNNQISAYCIVLGTVENADSSETEWALRSYINRKRKLLTNERE